MTALIAAAVLAATFTVAAVAKIRDQATTTADFGSLGLPRPELWARVIPVLELATAATLVILPGWGGVVAFGLLAAFTANLAMIVRSGAVATCACFGRASTAPVSGRHLVRNVVLLALALLAARFDGWSFSQLSA